MTSFDLVSAAAVLLTVGGLVAVLWEVLAKDPRGLLEMMNDTRRFAEAAPARHVAPLSRRSTPAAKTAAEPDHPRLAA